MAGMVVPDWVGLGQIGWEALPIRGLLKVAGSLNRGDCCTTFVLPQKPAANAPSGNLDIKPRLTQLSHCAIIYSVYVFTAAAHM